MRFAAAGFSVVEMLVAMTIAVILVLLALPLLTTTLANSQIRTATESMLGGLRSAQVEAIKLNALTTFVVDPDVGWEVRDTANTILMSRKLIEGSPKTTVTVTPPAGSRVTFNGLGRIIANADASEQLARIDIASSSSIEARPLRVVVGQVGIKMCDPAFASTDPVGCPP